MRNYKDAAATLTTNSTSASSSSCSGTALFVGYTFVSCFWFACLWLSLFTRFFLFLLLRATVKPSQVWLINARRFCRLPLRWELVFFLVLWFFFVFIFDLVPCYNLLWLLSIFYFLMYNQPAANWIDDFGIKCLCVCVYIHAHTHIRTHTCIRSSGEEAAAEEVCALRAERAHDAAARRGELRFCATLAPIDAMALYPFTYFNYFLLLLVFLSPHIHVCLSLCLSACLSSCLLACFTVTHPKSTRKTEVGELAMTCNQPRRW